MEQRLRGQEAVSMGRFGNFIFEFINFYWPNSKLTFKRGEKHIQPDDVTIDENWKWDDEWTIDLNRAVDNEGWEYCIESSVGGWSPSEKMFHLNRRRRWIRSRSVVNLEDYHLNSKVSNYYIEILIEFLT